MSKLAVIYWSGTGNTKAMAEAVAEGAKGAGAEVALLNVSETTADAAASYDKLALGCSAMGDEVLEEAEFEPFSSSWSPASQERTSPCSAPTAGATVSGCAIGRSAPMTTAHSCAASR